MTSSSANTSAIPCRFIVGRNTGYGPSVVAALEKRGYTLVKVRKSCFLRSFGVQGGPGQDKLSWPTSSLKGRQLLRRLRTILHHFASFVILALVSRLISLALSMAALIPFNMASPSSVTIKAKKSRICAA